MPDQTVPTPFAELFTEATGNPPFHFQGEFAQTLPSLIRVPTGAGKTAMAVLGWLWRRQFAGTASREATPRRLVYCLPMRVLVEQTRDNAKAWLGKLNLLDETADRKDPTKVAVSVLMGGEDRDEWDLYPERDAILIGTQDMLLSRALNRGYGMTRFRWPMHFGLLNNDALWVFDEIQLMGSGLATTSQLEAFRNSFGTTSLTRSVWMSATLEPRWLATVDFKPPATMLELTAEDARSESLSRRMNADKPLARAAARTEHADVLAREVRAAHRPASRTLIVLNTVDRALSLYAALKKASQKAKDGPHPKLVLVHSRFRPADRAMRVNELLAPPPPEGVIVISTQVVEAGVDVSAKTLFTDLAPWASLVQRFGRCNRVGDDPDARVFWMDWPDEAQDEGAEKKRETLALPYAAADLAEAREHLLACSNVGPNSLPKVALRHEQPHVIRRKDFVELFDTTPDLAGNDIDVSRYVREADDLSVQVFWRDLKEEAPPEDESLPRREELCSVRIGAFKEFLSRLAKKPPVPRWRPYRRNYLDGTWEVAGDDAIFPGQVLMLDAAVGGYNSDAGWLGEPGQKVISLRPADEAKPPDTMDADDLSEGRKWESIAQHTSNVCDQLDAILREVKLPQADILRLAARWHDRGKAHNIFQDAAAVFDSSGHPDAAQWIKERVVAKTGARGRLRYKRGGKEAKHFRHELASALAVLHPSSGLPDTERNLIAYLSAAHHGKVRLSIRSMPDELRQSGRLFARGVWDQDEMGQSDLGGGTTAPPVVLSLELMGLGLCERPPFEGQPSWAERMLALRDHSDLGPFRLACLETLLRAADERASESKSPKLDPREGDNA